MTGILLLDALAVIGLIILVCKVGIRKESGTPSGSDVHRKSGAWSGPVTKWRDDDVVITYRVKPPHFRDVPTDDPMNSFETCGFCKYYKDNGCEKYGVKGYGVGSVVQTVCDDFITAFSEE